MHTLFHTKNENIMEKKFAQKEGKKNKSRMCFVFLFHSSRKLLKIEIHDDRRFKNDSHMHEKSKQAVKQAFYCFPYE